MRNEHTTLFLTEKRAIEAAEAAKWGYNYTGEKEPSFRILSATMKDYDGTIDQGFKVLITPTTGELPYYL